MKTTILFVGALLVGCGGDGVSGSKKLSELTMEESKDVCLELVADYPEKTVTCGPDVTITVGLKASECTGMTPDAGCEGTVADSRACNEAIYNQTTAQLCSDSALPAACAKLAGCL